MPKPLTVWITINCGKFWKMGIPDHLTCLLRNLHAGQEATCSSGHGTTDWFQIGKRGCILSPCLLNLYAEYIMWNARLDAAQTRIKIPGRNINTFVYADDTTLTAESKELKSFLIKMKEESENFGLKLHVQKTKIIASGAIILWQIDGETVETVTDFIWGAPKSLKMVTEAMKLKDTCSLEEKLWPTKFSSIKFSCSVVSDSLRSRGITLPTKVRLVKALFFQ